MINENDFNFDYQYNFQVSNPESTTDECICLDSYVSDENDIPIDQHLVSLTKSDITTEIESLINEYYNF